MDSFVNRYCANGKRVLDTQIVHNFENEIHNPNSPHYMCRDFKICIFNDKLDIIENIIMCMDWTNWYNIYTNKCTCEYTGLVCWTITDRKYYPIIVAKGSKYEVLSMHNYGLDIHSHPVGDHHPSIIDRNNIKNGYYSLLVTDIGVIIYGKHDEYLYPWNMLKYDRSA